MLSNSMSWAGIAGFAIALLILAALRPRQSKTIYVATHPAQATEDGIVFLFHDQTLVDATADALTLIGQGNKHLTDYEATLVVLEDQFPDLRTTLADSAVSSIKLHSHADPALFIDVQKSSNRVRLELNSSIEMDALCVAERWMKAASNTETSLMRDVITHSPQLVWHCDKDGHVLWANHAYASFAQTHSPQTPPFADLLQTDASGTQRVKVNSATDESAQWFDIQIHPREDGFLHFASNTNALVSVDQERREFVQALGKTFAQLSVGLAIFNKERRLVMFNPALVDMTNLPTEFLAPKPTIEMFLDRLREKAYLPERKNYGSWREQFTAVEAAAKEDSYCENWTLPDGQIFRVTGRRHPDGAFAFLFEDISAEISLTRRFRSDIETGQAVLDKLPDAIAVFSAAGTLVMSNHAYSTLWQTNHELMLEHRELRSEMTIWQERCIPSPIWNDMRGFVQQQGARQPWSDNAMLEDGRQLGCIAEAVTGGMTMVRFEVKQPMRPVIQKIIHSDQAIQAAKR